MSPPYRRNETGNESWTDPRQSMSSSNKSRGRRGPRKVVELPESTQPRIEDPVPYRHNPFLVRRRYSACKYHHIRNERLAPQSDPCELLSFEDNFASTIHDAVGSDWRYYPPYDTDPVSTQDCLNYTVGETWYPRYSLFDNQVSQDAAPWMVQRKWITNDPIFETTNVSSATCCVCEKIKERPAIVPLQGLYMDQVCKRCELLSNGIKQLKNEPETSGSGMLELFTRATGLRFDTKSMMGIPFEFSVQGSWPEQENPRFHCLPTLDDDIFTEFEPYNLLQDVVQQLDVDRVVSLLGKWTSSCDLFHPQCKPRTGARLPKRVISIPQEDTGTIKLLEEPVDINAGYIALSYCWGPSGTRFRTTLATLPTYLEEIPVSHFPRLFLDVISICKALGIRYLWIDALCIIQDSLEDWELQSAQMASIYSNSYLTIAATACADPSATLFSERWTECVLNKERIRIGIGSTSIRSEAGTVRMRPSLRLAHDRFTDVDNAQDHMTDAPLLTRAWTYQERLLPAHTLHFHAEELVWECKSGVRCECGHLDHQEHQSAEPYNQEIPYKLQPDRWLKSFIAQAEQADKSLEDLCNIWMDLISEYSGLSLTYEGDRLPALSGLAVNFSNKPLGEYVAGMWTKALPALLLWEVCSRSEKPLRQCDVSSPSAPSWSWASVRLSSGVAVTYTRAINVAAEVLDDLEIVSVRAEVIGKNPYGWVRNAVLQVRGRTVECVAIDIAGGGIVLTRDDPEVATEEEPGTEHAIMELIMDYQGIYQPDMKVMALSIGSRFGIALEKIVTEASEASESPVYRRIGLVVWKENKETGLLLRNDRGRLKMRQVSII